MLKVSLLLLGFLLFVVGCNTQKTNPYSILDSKNNQIDVLIFSSTACPIANSMAPAIQRLHQEVEVNGGQTYLIHVWKTRTHKEATEHARQYGLTMDIVLDNSHLLVNEFGVTVTPEVVVLKYDSQETPVVLYQGLINNLFDSPGNRRDRATEHYAADAYHAAIRGERMPIEYRQPVGCRIELNDD